MHDQHGVLIRENLGTGSQTIALILKSALQLTYTAHRDLESAIPSTEPSAQWSHYRQVPQSSGLQVQPRKLLLVVHQSG